MVGNGRSDDKVEVAHISGFAALAAQTRAHQMVADRRNGEGDSDDAHTGGVRSGDAHVDGAGPGAGAIAEGAADAPDIFATVTEHAPMPQKTCAVCAARNDADRDSCWNCGASLRRVR